MNRDLFRPATIVSGGQTGADRAALDAAIELGLRHGGWVPKGRRAEDGPLAPRYQVRETETPDYAERTEKNVLDSDATLVATFGPPSGGTALTLGLARKHRKPCLLIDFTGTDIEQAARRLREWLDRVRPAVLNVAGPRASTAPGVYGSVRRLLRRALA